MNLFNAMNLFKCFLWNLKIKVLFLLIKYEIIVFFIHYEGNAERRKFSFVCTAQCYQITFQDIVNEICLQWIFFQFLTTLPCLCSTTAPLEQVCPQLNLRSETRLWWLWVWLVKRSETRFWWRDLRYDYDDCWMSEQAWNWFQKWRQDWQDKTTFPLFSVTSVHSFPHSEYMKAISMLSLPFAL